MIHTATATSQSTHVKTKGGNGFDILSNTIPLLAVSTSLHVASTASTDGLGQL